MSDDDMARLIAMLKRMLKIELIEKKVINQCLK